MSPELSKKLATAVDGMPAFPKSVQKILELTRDVNSTPNDLVQVIDKDPVVTVKVLRVVNSAYYSLPKQITSINHAVVYLGFNTIKNLALSIAAIGMLPASNEAGFDGQQYLIHSSFVLSPLNMAGSDSLLVFQLLSSGDFESYLFLFFLVNLFGFVLLGCGDFFRRAHLQEQS